MSPNLFHNLSLKEGIFLLKWKIAQVAPVHKKNDTHLLSNYQSISLLSIFSKFFKKQCIVK